MYRRMLAVIGLITALSASAMARQPDWQLLGEKSVGFLVDRDVIDVGQTADWYANRAFKALHFQVERNDVHFEAIELVYLNGYAETVNIDRLVRAGEEIPIDLRGERSYIKQIGMRYRSRPNFRGQAVVRVMAEPARRGSVPPPSAPPPIADRGNWEVLGEQTVGFEVDRDVIRVGRREGRFSRIRLEVRGNDVFVKNIRVRFANGEEQSFELREEIRAGSRSRPLDLSGDRRFIERIELTYRARPGFRGQATVAVLGEQGAGRPESSGPPPRRDRAIIHSAETLRFFRSYGGRKVVEQGVRSVEFRVPELGVGQQTLILIAHGRPVRVRSLDIRFHSIKDGGKPQIADLNMRLDPSEGTPLIDIPGSARFPVRVTVEVEPLGRGEAQLELMLSGNKIERIMRDQR